MSRFEDTPIEYLKGVGPQRAELLQQELGIFTFGDLLNHFPFRYIDRTKVHTVSELQPDMSHIQLRGVLTDLVEQGKPRQKRLTATFTDATGSVDLVWFKGVSYLKSSLKNGETYTLYGKPTVYNRRYNIAHPELESEQSNTKQPSFQAVYPLTEKLKSRKIENRVIRTLIASIFQHERFQLEEFLPESVAKPLKLISRELAYKWIHFPSNQTEMTAALNRLKFDEFFILQLSIQRLRQKRSAIRGFIFGEVGERFNQFYQEQMAFELTEAQKRVIREIRRDMGSGKQMNRLLQGDVGSGKSIVAILCILLAVDNGYQASLMAPTEILAGQHYEGFKEALESVGVTSALLTGSTKQAERNRILDELKTGALDVLIGTHALIEDPVVFKNQGLAIIDEQHRFGVAQRARMWQKSETPPHILVMTATPIPRTLAMTVYGDLEVSRIDELPGGRKPIITAHRRESQRLPVISFIRKEIEKGRQVYVVFPLIEESETLDYKNLSDGFDHLTYYFERPKFQVDMLHGRMKPEEKDYAMKRFKDGIADILVSTTVIEVGINVPNATVMLIESAEKFGLAQLHQLRGRVGRGGEQSYCILMTGNKLTAVAKERISAMVETSDGFEIAERDLRLRGPGDIEGTRQSGLINLKLASITKDEGILIAARTAASSLLEKDPNLSAPEHANLRTYIRHQRGLLDWSRIS
ncbi:MAG: ATP-dependent DNA helicase RecG [Flavobacteriales bacterium]|nr:ATP-dependent DNA helicase RecG [Flavobacteriales bacterium]